MCRLACRFAQQNAAIRYLTESASRGDPWAGVGAAYIIQEQSPDGYGRSDTATFGAKAAALSDPDAKKEAMGLLGRMNRNLVDSAASS